MGFEIRDELLHKTYFVEYASVTTYKETYMNKVPMHTNVQSGYE